MAVVLFSRLRSATSSARPARSTPEEEGRTAGQDGRERMALDKAGAHRDVGMAVHRLEGTLLPATCPAAVAGGTMPGTSGQSR